MIKTELLIKTKNNEIILNIETDIRDCNIETEKDILSSIERITKEKDKLAEKLRSETVKYAAYTTKSLEEFEEVEGSIKLIINTTLDAFEQYTEKISLLYLILKLKNVATIKVVSKT